MLPGLFRTLVGLVFAWLVFRFLDRLFGASWVARPPQGRPVSSRERLRTELLEKAKDDHLGEYVEFEEVKGTKKRGRPSD